VERELESILSRENTLIFQAMRYTVFSGGKRYRPLLTLSSGEYFGASRRDLLPFACALELIHNYSLIHDDLPSMDNDDFRRGKPSSHKVFGEGIALLAGDALLTLAFEVMADAPLDAGLLPQKNKVIDEISHCAGAEGMVKGQMMDITLSPENMNEENIYEKKKKKTGSLIMASVKTGAILGNASASQLEAIIDFGKNIGIAFQIRDDILDSIMEKKKSRLIRPNYVHLFGLSIAEQKLKEFVENGLKSLAGACLDSEELRYLATILLDIENEKEEKQNS